MTRRVLRYKGQANLEEWQVGRSSTGCNDYMFEKQLCCDVKFEAGRPKTDVGAHRYILASRSPVFFQMLSTSAIDTIPLPDVSPDALKAFLRYLYTDKISFTPDNVLPVLYISKQFKIGTLQSQCLGFIKSCLSAGNVFMYLQQASMYQEQELFQDCLLFIKRNGEASLKSDHFLMVGQDLVDLVVSQDDLQAEERTVYERVVQWAKTEAGRRGSDVSDKSIRDILGNTLYHVRFTQLNISYFACEITRGSLLTDTEKVIIFRYFTKADASALPFNTSRRQVPVIRNEPDTSFKSCVRFMRTIGPLDCPFDDVTDANRHIGISFSSPRNISLKGFLLYRGTKPMYQVNMKLFSGNANLVHEESMTVTSFTDSPADITRVELNTPVRLLAQSVYTISVRSSSPNMFYGVQGQIQVQSGRESFMFYECPLPDCSSSLSHGDLPGLVYTVF